MGFIRLFGTTYLKISSQAKKWPFIAVNSWEFKLLHTKLSCLVLVPEVRNRHQIREVSMGLCETSDVSIFTLINASDLKFFPRSYSSCVYLMMKFKGSNGKVCNMMTSHFRTLWRNYWTVNNHTNGKTNRKSNLKATRHAHWESDITK